MKKPTELKIEFVRRGVAQCDVAAAAGLSESRVSRILNGRVRARDYELKNIAKALEIPRDELPA